MLIIVIIIAIFLVKRRAALHSSSSAQEVQLEKYSSISIQGTLKIADEFSVESKDVVIKKEISQGYFF